MWPTSSPSGRPIAVGCMRLSTDADRDDARSIAVIQAALAAGVRMFDTADVYCRDEHDIGHNERLIRNALASSNINRSDVLIATKGGLTRPQGRWMPDGRARHLVSACHASLDALGVDRIQLYQLHAPDPRTPLATSMRALKDLQRDRVIEHIGLCNVTVGQIEEARRIAEVSSVQVELSPWNDSHVLSGVVRYCIDHDVRILAYRPLGGPERSKRLTGDRVLDDIASRHQTTAAEIALAWLLALSDAIVPLPGATRIQTTASIARAFAIRLSGAEIMRLDEHFPSGILRRSPIASGGAPASASGEIVLIMGLPGAGKSTAAMDFVAKGYTRVNRDDDGGSLRDLVSTLSGLLESGTRRVVLDNTYVSRKSRAPVVHAAARTGLAVRCVWLATSIEDAQVNAAGRMLARYGRLLAPDEMRSATKTDVSAFGPTVQFRYQRELEPPDAAEGFSRIDVCRFDRTRDASATGRAVFLWCDGVLIRSRSGLRVPISTDDVDVAPRRADVLQRYVREGWRLLGLAWRPEIADATTSPAQVDAVFMRMQELLGVTVEVRYCPHGGGAPACWCRKPLPGLGVEFIRRHRLDPSRSIYVGSGAQDPGFARRLGLEYRDAEEFFGA